MSIKPIAIDGDLVLSLAASVANSVDSDFQYYFNILEEDRLEACTKSSKRTLVHDFIETICCEQITYIMCKHFDEEAIEIMKSWFDAFCISYPEFVEEEADQDYRAIEQYADALQIAFNETVLPKISEAVFCILFNDKTFLYRFNVKVTEQILLLKKEDYPNYLEADGRLIRHNPPTWLKKGVFHRDRGICQSCGRNLDNVFQNAEDSNYDHIIPLSKGGSNDPSNYQLMCEHCNKSKNARTEDYQNIIWPFWNM